MIESNKTLYILVWTEYDEGIQRDDGVSFHLSLEDALSYQKEFSNGNRGCYWRAFAPREVFVSEELYQQVKDKKFIHAYNQVKKVEMWVLK